MKLLYWITYSNLFIASCAASLSYFCHVFLFGSTPSTLLSLFVFSSTLFAYNFHRRLGRVYAKNNLKSINDQLQENQKEQWLTNHKSAINWIILLSFSATLTLLYILPKQLLILIFPLATLSLFYILQINKIPSLRSIPFLKIFIIAFVWGGTMVLLPVLANKTPNVLFNWKAQTLAICIGLFVFGETIPFDIRDLKEDRLINLKTIPSKIGLKKSKLLSLISYIISGILFIGLCIQFNKPINFTITFLLSLIASFLLISKVNSNKKELYYSFGIESSLAFPFLFYQILCFLTYFAS